MNIHIVIVDAADLGRGFTGADWFFDENGDLQVRVSKLSNWRREIALGIHEAVEAALCKHAGITQEDVDRFDHDYEATHTSDLNAGDDPHAPYHRQHCLATVPERMLIAEFGENWLEYDLELEHIPLHIHAVQKLKKLVNG